MWIERLEIDAFGKLQDTQLELNQGFQVLYGENEAGKTTLMAFLKLMFYGKMPRIQGLENPRKRYMPWDGRRMGGAVDFVSEGVHYRLQKEFGDTPGRDKVKLLHTGRGEMIPLGKDEEIGQRFFGLDLAGFERSSFIGRVGGMDAGKSDAVAERLLSNLAQSGDENIPAQETLDRLAAAKYDLVSKSGGKGLLAEARQQMQALRDELSATELYIREQESIAAQCRPLEEEVQRLQELETKYQGAIAWQRVQRLDVLLGKAEQFAQQIVEFERSGMSWQTVKLFLYETEPLVEEYRLAVRSLEELRANSKRTEETEDIDDASFQRIEACAEKADALERLFTRMQQDLLPAAMDLCAKQSEAGQAVRGLEETQAALAEQARRRTQLEEQRTRQRQLLEQLDALRGEQEKQRAIWEREQADAQDRHAEAERALALQIQLRNLNKRPYVAIGIAVLIVVLSMLAAVVLTPFFFAGLLVAAVLFWSARRTPPRSEQEIAAEQACTQAAAEAATVQAHAQAQEQAWYAELDRIRAELETVEQVLADWAQEERAWKTLDAKLQQQRSIMEQAAVLEQAAVQVYQRALTAVQPLAEAADCAAENLAADAVQSLYQEVFAEHSRWAGELQELLARQGCDSMTELHEKVLAQRVDARSRAAMQEMEKTLQARGQALMAQVKPYQAVSSPEKAIELVSALRATWETMTQLETELRGAATGLGLEDATPETLRNERQALQVAVDTYDPEADPEPELLRQEIERIRKKDAAGRLLALQKRLRAPERTPSEIILDMDGLAEDIAEMERYAAAVDLALTVMQESVEEMRSSFGPALNQATSEMLSALTGGTYGQVLVSKDYGLSVKTGAHYREHTCFSSGTIDQMYLALRLAISKLISEGQEPLPLLLDDVLMQYDADRAAHCIDYLARCGREGTQILLFTCHPHIVDLAQASRVSCLSLRRDMSRINQAGKALE